MTRVPRIVHYVVGMASDFGGKPWSLVHHACLMSAIERIRPDAVLFHYEYEPTGPWWKLSRPLVTLMPMKAPREIFGNPVEHVAHRAGVTRLRVLLEHGGIYLDADVLVQRSFDDLLEFSTAMGREGFETEYGLADAVIVAEKNAPFIARWLDSYRSFRSKGRDEFWAEHAVWIPAQLAKDYRDEIEILPHTAFFWPLWTEEHLNWIYRSTRPIETGAYANHLWEAAAWPYFRDLTPRRVRTVDTNFHRWLRPFVADLAGAYGAPGVATRTARLSVKCLRRLWEIAFGPERITVAIAKLLQKPQS